MPLTEEVVWEAMIFTASWKQSHSHLSVNNLLPETVRDKISNEVLVGATVKVIDENNEEILTAITDNDGNYSLTCDCNQGNFVRAQTQGYVPAEEYLGVSDGKPRIMDFYLEREKVTAGFGRRFSEIITAKHYLF